MSLELQALTAGLTGRTTYFVLYDTAGQVWDGSAFAVASAANRNAGAVLATELGTASGAYAANAPTLAAGVYSYALFERAGGSPAEGDTLLAGPGELQWGGSAVKGLADVPTAVQGAAAVLAAAATAPLAANVKKVNDTTLQGDGTANNPWGP